MKRVLLLAAVLSLATSCGLLGDSSPPLPRVRNGGTGPFRTIDNAETELRAPPEGRIATNVGTGEDGYGFESFARVAWTNDGCYVSRATRLTPTPMRDPGAPSGEPDPSQFGPTGIAICEGSDASIVMTTGDLVLTASEPWEGTDLRDPWPLRMPDGTVRLYYVGDGGIGVAEAAEPGGPFTRASTGPVVSPIDVARPLGSPAVVPAPDGEGYLMYFDDGTDIFLATSTDGLAFTRADADESTPAIDPITLTPTIEDETTRRHPGAVTVITEAGRRVVRLYFDVTVGEDGNVAMAGSFDGRSFERVPLPTYTSERVAYPVPRILPAGQTVLSMSRALTASTVIVRAPVGAVAPIFTSFDAGL